ncbi:adenylate/guanylate cyclase domain-containing protein [Variovorax beijingensis]|uniref:Adenylate/guanylate cyclase domain-containing protein n=1 Tax=Variovorax beijingensis TaxID=2496117 RepID=A0A3P3END1_9BURK|nr:adenylate/guanylate cyclase domain-containing protein [Variovorax beijingensis]RRH87312.1 adenylate/guanylate cyclase domain-containing protein [Variovorax beijingensis]RSZ35602.1 adenylate/guanylate cyclase domain-containing protein [Variovorax beijingensis]
MDVNSTVVFADLTGSSRVFEAMGNARATDTVTRLTQWIGSVCQAHGGRVVKSLGDGVFAIFSNASSAMQAVIELQRYHQKRLMTWPVPLRMALQIGVASGEVVEVEGDCFGDAVNLASRLSDLAGPGQIWATDAAIAQLGETGVRHRDLGLITIRGRSEMSAVHRIDWQEEMTSFLTLPAALTPLRLPDSSLGQIELAWLDVRSTFRTEELPIHLGRVSDAQFVVNDPRVSRLHARIELRHGSCVLTDLSTYGTWVRFHGNGGPSQEVALRREECVLHGSGEIGLGAPLSDFTAPTIAFNTAGTEVQLSRREIAS